jgi:hypothetical protein
MRKLRFLKCVTLVRKVGGDLGVGRKTTDAMDQRFETMSDSEKPH